LFNDRCIHMSTPNRTKMVRWSLDLRYQPTDQDPMPQHGVGFLARSYQHPERVATLADWLAKRAAHEAITPVRSQLSHPGASLAKSAASIRREQS
jgi:phytanoyl-CoA hydroxylase